MSTPEGGFLEILGRFIFTGSLLLTLTVVGIWSRTHVGQISKAWLERFGFAPKDLWLFRVEKLFLSALITHGKKSFWLAFIAIAGMVGPTEWRHGSLYVALLFWGVHTLTLLITSLVIIYPLQRMRISLGEALAVAKDVGPSAGYFGCLGSLVMLAGHPGSWALAGTFLAGLTVLYFLPPGPEEEPLVKKHSDLAHLIAFLLGIAAARF